MIFLIFMISLIIGSVAVLALPEPGKNEGAHAE